MKMDKSEFMKKKAVKTLLTDKLSNKMNNCKLNLQKRKRKIEIITMIL